MLLRLASIAIALAFCIADSMALPLIASHGGNTTELISRYQVRQATSITNSLTLDRDLAQAGSQLTGQASDADADQADSSTSDNNFINDCSGKTLTNGLQVKGGSCNGVVMGEIPSQQKMVSTIITNPTTGATLEANRAFNVTMQIANLDTGSFTNPQTTYYSAPQSLNTEGFVVGHTHVTIQDMGGDLNPSQPLDASKFVFFKGIDDPAINGQLIATVSGGLPAGSYRVCTMSSASNHQSVLMPVAQRGAQDDCSKFTVEDSANTTKNVKLNQIPSTSQAKTAVSTSATSIDDGDGQQQKQQVSSTPQLIAAKSPQLSQLVSAQSSTKATLAGLPLTLLTELGNVLKRDSSNTTGDGALDLLNSFTAPSNVMLASTADTGITGFKLISPGVNAAVDQNQLSSDSSQASDSAFSNQGNTMDGAGMLTTADDSVEAADLLAQISKLIHIAQSGSIDSSTNVNALNLPSDGLQENVASSGTSISPADENRLLLAVKSVTDQASGSNEPDTIQLFATSPSFKAAQASSQLGASQLAQKSATAGDSTAHSAVINLDKRDPQLDVLNRLADLLQSSLNTATANTAINDLNLNSLLGPLTGLLGGQANTAVTNTLSDNVDALNTNTQALGGTSNINTKSNTHVASDADLAINNTKIDNDWQDTPILSTVSTGTLPGGNDVNVSSSEGSSSPSSVLDVFTGNA